MYCYNAELVTDIKDGYYYIIISLSYADLLTIFLYTFLSEKSWSFSKKPVKAGQFFQREKLNLFSVDSSFG